MADEERKEDAEKQGENAAAPGGDAEAAEAAEASRAESPSADEARAKDEGEARAADEDGGEGDEAAERVAKALGVADEGEGEGEAKAEGAAEETAAAPNRAARRREEAMQRRKKRKGAAKAEGAAEEEGPLPKDKNARAKELLKRRREQASGPRPIQLLPSEMVDDAVARSTSAASKWLRENFSKLQWVLLAAVAGVGGYLLYTSQTQQKSAAATDTLLAGVSADLGRIAPEDKRSDEEKEFDAVKVYKTAEERSEAAVAGYRKAIEAYPQTTTAQLAKLGEAGALLEKRDWAGAADAYTAVLASKLASVDVDVKGRATEGLGLAKEGKGDLDGALAAFKDLESVDAPGFKELGLYQQGRILFAKGDKDKAAEVLKQVRDKLQANGEASASVYLKGAVDETLRRIDPNFAPNRPMVGGPKGNASSPEEMERMRKLFDEAMKKKPGGH